MDILRDQLEVYVDGATYAFRIPSIRFDSEVDTRVKSVIRRAIGGTPVDVNALDGRALYFARCCAILELYLVDSDVTWPFTTTGAVDFAAFATGKASTVCKVGDAFYEAYASLAKTGLPTTTLLARKLWQAAKIQGHKNPFGKALIDYNPAELDFVLEMEALDNPREFRFEREGVASDGSHNAAVRAAWASALTGRSLAQSLSGIAFDAVARWRARRGGQGGLKPGIRTRAPEGRKDA
ncbi:MAG: hypothetical protein M0Z28_08315 [Rhodospirillales bacterium]|nr:hypothetical protein [Rhodospirillales bacterium]